MIGWLGPSLRPTLRLGCILLSLRLVETKCAWGAERFHTGCRESHWTVHRLVAYGLRPPFKPEQEMPSMNPAHRERCPDAWLVRGTDKQLPRPWSMQSDHNPSCPLTACGRCGRTLQESRHRGDAAGEDGTRGTCDRDRGQGRCEATLGARRAPCMWPCRFKLPIQSWHWHVALVGLKPAHVPPRLDLGERRRSDFVTILSDRSPKTPPLGRGQTQAVRRLDAATEHRERTQEQGWLCI